MRACRHQTRIHPYIYTCIRYKPEQQRANVIFLFCAFRHHLSLLDYLVVWLEKHIQTGPNHTQSKQYLWRSSNSRSSSSIGPRISYYDDWNYYLATDQLDIVVNLLLLCVHTWWRRWRWRRRPRRHSVQSTKSEEKKLSGSGGAS